ncbi:hypothetical protein CCHL11_06457 [Colletotrichum chlorophyti]|uniref:DUF7357 domain-containing protein n=1 Tax=Colletotrichum chlorophyti TaxID=708187 RepID=A0A1Q8RRR8_9PEZI|nr:hypothetical protein CCHL11_06457 [Colletotrichum chlorophyti]
MEKDLRLRLVVRRHGVPDVKLLWNVTANEDLTISKLVAQINEVIPLESGEWGLEDYAVELKDASGEGFECVHYHLVAKVFKDDDHVLIRPLLTDDLRRRRLSGRHQISVDGKHLVDGLAFGRPWLRAPRDRPAIPLPPRKKARIDYSSEDDEEYPSEGDDEIPMLEYDSTRAEEDPASGRLRARFYDAEPDQNHEEDDEDFEPGADNTDDEAADTEDDNLQEELRMIREDNAAAREGDIVKELRKIRDRRSKGTGKGRRSLAANEDSPVPSSSNALVRSGGKSFGANPGTDPIDRTGALRRAFPDAPISAIEHTLLKCDGDPTTAYRRLRKSFGARLSLSQVSDHTARSASAYDLRQAFSNAGRRETIREQRSSSVQGSYALDPAQADSETSVTVNHTTHVDHTGSLGGSDEISSSDSDSDSDFDSDSSLESGSNAGDAESRQQMDSTSEEDSGSSFDSSDDSQAAAAALEGEHTGSEVQDKSSSDESSSDDSSVSSTKRRSSGKNTVVPVSSDSSESSSEDSSSGSDSSSDSDSDSEPEEMPTKTLSNQHKIMQPAKSLHSPKAPQLAAPATNQTLPVPPGQGLTKTQKRNARRKLAKKSAAQAHSSSFQSIRELSCTTPSAAEEQAAFLARKQALLDAIISDIPSGPDSQNKSQEIPNSAPQDVEHEDAPALPSQGDETPRTSDSHQGDVSAQRRMKPNIGAARRMLMGSLGLKNPKTKADEDKIRQDLMKGVRPHINARLIEATSQPDEPSQTNESVEEDSEAWREKIAYRAVECCHEGVELSEPPFPFVQRWDPQQHVEEWFGSKNKRGGKRKRVQRNQAQYCDDGDSQTLKKRRINADVTFSDAVESLEEGDTTLNYDDPSDEPTTEPVPEVAADESQAADNEDLPPLPSDLTTLSPLQPGQATLGMVITWKHWLLTPGKWQPEVVDLTGIVVRVYDEDGTDLEFLLAQRDRNLERVEKMYDDAGNRVYDRFEAPDDNEDDEDDEPDDGYRRLKYAELIEPRVLQYPMSSRDKAKASGSESWSVGPTESIIHETVYDDQNQPSPANGANAEQSEADEDGSQLQVDTQDSQTKANMDFGQPQRDKNSSFRHDAASGASKPNLDPETLGSIAGDGMDGGVPVFNSPRRSPYGKDDMLVATTEWEGLSHISNAPSNSSDCHDISMAEEAGFSENISPTVIHRKTSSPSRQLAEMSEAFGTSSIPSKSPRFQDNTAKEGTPVPNKNLDISDSTGDTSAKSSPSMGSVHSGRQPDVDFSLTVGGDDLPQISDTGEGSLVLGFSAPETGVRTPTRADSDSEPPSTGSFPSLETLFQTAMSQSQHNTQSPSKAQALTASGSRNAIVQFDEEYEAAMRQIDGEDEDKEHQSSQEFGSARKRLFPISRQPAPVSNTPDPVDVKPALELAPSVVSFGSQVIALSSSLPSSPEKDLKKIHAEDDVDDDHEENNRSLSHGSGRIQRNKSLKAATRARSVPAAKTATMSASARRTIPPSNRPAKSGVKTRAPRKSKKKF